ncbi:hypothetical protein DKP78_25455, partial [Enterococcus faecium]
MRNVHDHVAEHVEETAVGVVREAVAVIPARRLHAHGPRNRRNPGPDRSPLQLQARASPGIGERFASSNEAG